MDGVICLEEYGFPEGARVHIYEPSESKPGLEAVLIPGFLTDGPIESNSSCPGSKCANEWDFRANQIAEKYRVKTLLLRWPSESTLGGLSRVGVAAAGVSAASAVAARVTLGILRVGLPAWSIPMSVFQGLGALVKVKTGWDRAVINADETSRALGGFLRSRPADSVCLIGHSLGGRISIKALENTSDDGPSISSVALAPAVLDEEVEWDRIQSRPMPYPAGDALWSSGDIVLATLFRGGQLKTNLPIGFKGPRLRRRRLIHSVNVTDNGTRFGRRHRDYLPHLGELLGESRAFGSFIDR